MIHYTTIAFNEVYRTHAQQMIDSFLRHTKDAHLTVVTDDASTFTIDAPNVHIYQHPDKFQTFPANLKYKALEAAYNFDRSASYIVLMDADTIFIEEVKESDFDFPVGITAPLGDGNTKTAVASISNQTVRHKVMALTNEQSLHVFLERCVIFKPTQDFHRFIESWKQLYTQVTNERLTHCAECFEIQIAALNSNVPLNPLSHRHKLRNCLYTVERSGFTHAALK